MVPGSLFLSKPASIPLLLDCKEGQHGRQSLNENRNDTQWSSITSCFLGVNILLFYFEPVFELCLAK